MANKRGVKSGVTMPDMNQIREMADRGLSQRQIAFAMGISQPTVSRMVAKLREQREGLADDTALWHVIASDPESWLREQGSLLIALITIQQAWVAVCHGDINILAGQKRAVIDAYRVEHERRAIETSR